MDENVIEVLGNAKQKLEYLRRCAYTEKIPADSEDLRKLIQELEELISTAPGALAGAHCSSPCSP